jgi:hypothetical protein
VRILDRPGLVAQFQWEPRDLWVGMFWHCTPVAWHVYLCLVPMVPLHILLAHTPVVLWCRLRRRCRHCGAPVPTGPPVDYYTGRAKHQCECRDCAKLNTHAENYGGLGDATIDS